MTPAPPTSPASPAPARCAGCGTQLAGALLACPACHRLVHAEALARLADEARQREGRGDAAGALALWREALDLLPAGTRQRATVTAKVTALSRAVDASGGGASGGGGAAAVADGAPPRNTAARPASAIGRGLAAAGAVGLLLWKLKFILGFVLTKGKLLLLGLTKGGTFLTMVLSFGVYWTAFGWAFAAGLVASIYVHEMGHVAALRRLGFKTTAPMFVPGLGALIRLRQHPVDAREDARIGLAGPIWGALAAAAAYGLGLALGQPTLLAIARIGAWINLFNLLPVGPLDGGRGFRALSRAQAWLLLAVVAATWLGTGEGMLVLVGLVGLVRAFAVPREAPSDLTALLQFSALVVVLALMTRIPVPVPGGG